MNPDERMHMPDESYTQRALTVAQRSLLEQIVNRHRRNLPPVVVRGTRLNSARALERRGLVTVQIGGTSGAAWTGRWWYEAVPTEKGLDA